MENSNGEHKASKNNVPMKHGLLMLLCCLAPIILIAVLIIKAAL